MQAPWFCSQAIDLSRLLRAEDDCRIPSRLRRCAYLDPNKTRAQDAAPGESNRRDEVSRRPLRVFMMDLLATVPYYTAYLSRALLAEDVDLPVGSVSYYLDRKCFSSRGIKVSPGCLDLIS